MRQIEIVEKGVTEPFPGGQRGFAADWKHQVVGLEGGWMSGKTFIGARKLLTLHIHNAFSLVTGEPTGVPSAAISPTYGNALDFQVPELLDAAKNDANLSVRWRSTGSISQGRYAGPALIFPDLGTTDNPSVILVRSADRSDTITGWQVGVGWGDEPARWPEDRFDPRRDAYIQFQGRVRHPKSNFIQRMYTYTNEGDATRVYEEMHSGNPNVALYRATTKDNPRAKNFYKEMSQTLTRELQEQYLMGGAVSIRGGRAYPSFDRKLHVSGKLKLKKKYPLHLSADFNISPGMHFEIGQLWEEENKWEFVTVHEIYAPRLSVKEGMGLFRKLVEELGGWQWPELQVFGDAGGHSEWSGTGQTNISIIQQCLEQFGYPYRIRIPKANPMIVDRINAMELALQDINHVVHWRCHPSCIRLIEDRATLKRDEGGSISKRDRNLSHASDADDYRVEYLKPVRVTRSKIERGRYSVEVVPGA